MKKKTSHINAIYLMKNMPLNFLEKLGGQKEFIT
jgi:hypothetical protein